MVEFIGWIHSCSCLDTERESLALHARILREDRVNRLLTKQESNLVHLKKTHCCSPWDSKKEYTFVCPRFPREDHCYLWWNSERGFMQRLWGRKHWWLGWDFDGEFTHVRTEIGENPLSLVMGFQGQIQSFSSWSFEGESNNVWTEILMNTPFCRLRNKDICSELELVVSYAVTWWKG